PPSRWNTTPAHTVPASADVSPAGSNPSYGGAYQPNWETGSMPPPSSSPGVPLDPTTAAASGLKRSAYESPVTSVDQTPSSTGSSGQSRLESAVATSPSGSTETRPSVAGYSLRRDLQEAEQLVAAGKLKTALAKLSLYYGSPDLDEAQRTQLLQWLDALA